MTSCWASLAQLVQVSTHLVSIGDSLCDVLTQALVILVLCVHGVVHGVGGQDTAVGKGLEGVQAGWRMGGGGSGGGGGEGGVGAIGIGTW